MVPVDPEAQLASAIALVSWPTKVAAGNGAEPVGRQQRKQAYQSKCSPLMSLLDVLRAVVAAGISQLREGRWNR